MPFQNYKSSIFFEKLQSFMKKIVLLACGNCANSNLWTGKENFQYFSKTCYTLFSLGINRLSFEKQRYIFKANAIVRNIEWQNNIIFILTVGFWI